MKATMEFNKGWRTVGDEEEDFENPTTTTEPPTTTTEEPTTTTEEPSTTTEAETTTTAKATTTTTEATTTSTAEPTTTLAEPTTTLAEPTTTHVETTTTTVKEPTTTAAEPTTTIAEATTTAAEVPTTTTTAQETTVAAIITESPSTTTTTAKPVLPVPSPPGFEYPVTSQYYYPNIEQNTSAVNEDAPNPIQNTHGPFGFGQAVQTEQTCLEITNISKPEDVGCFMQPSKCTEGISLSLWESIKFDEDDTQNRYLFSTGGDIEGTPGIALYHTGINLTAVVSNGSHYWYLYSVGTVPNDTWSNIGLIWKEDQGLKLFVDAKQVGQIVYPFNGEAQEEKKSLDPPRGVVGCRISAGPTYSDYGNAELDELAIWMSAVNDSMYFMGGYNTAESNMSLDQIRAILKNKELNLDQETLPILVGLLDKMTKKGSVKLLAGEEEKAVNTNGVKVILYEPKEGDETRMTTPTPGSEADKAEKLLAELSKDSQARGKSLVVLKEILKLLMDPRDLPANMTLEEYKTNRDLLQIVSNTLSDAYCDDWKKLQNAKQGSSSEIIEIVQDWAIASLQKVDVPDAEKNSLIKASENVVVSASQVTKLEMQKQRGIILPNYNKPEWKDVEWNPEKADNLADTVKIPEGIFNTLDDNEHGHIVTTVYNSYNCFAPLAVRKGKLPNERIFIDGKVIAVAIKPNDAVKRALKDNPLTVTIGHIKKEKALRRQLLFHSTDKQLPTVKRRYCARWLKGSEKENGTWISEGCKLLVDKPEYTMCDCRHPGIFAILAQNILRAPVRTDPEWLWITKYIGYGLSVFLLIIYITIILWSKYLKDQFHIMRVHLSIAVIGGTAAIFASDYYRHLRHECTAISACMQYLYTASAMWLLMESFAIFCAMITGYVGGRLKAYIPLAWGFPALPLGLAFIANMEDYGLEQRCMISWNDDLKWLFFGPMLACGVLGTIFCGISICNLSFSKLRRDFYLEDLGSVSKGLFCILMIYIMTWIFACYAYLDIEQVDPDFYPIFQVLNSWLGILIFLFMGIGSKKFRLVLTGKIPQQSLLNNIPANLIPIKPQPKYPPPK